MQKLKNDLEADGNNKFEELAPKDQIAIHQFYESADFKNERRMMIMARESSIQLVYQKALLLYQFVYPPLKELDFTNGKIGEINPFYPHVVWIVGLAFQMISIGLSAYSTFNPIIENTKLNGFKENKRAPGLVTYVLQLLQVILYIMFATGVVYLP